MQIQFGMYQARTDQHRSVGYCQHRHKQLPRYMFVVPEPVFPRRDAGWRVADADTSSLFGAIFPSGEFRPRAGRHIVREAFSSQLQRGFKAIRSEWLVQPPDRLVMVAGHGLGGQYDALHVLHISHLVEGRATDVTCSWQSAPKAGRDRAKLSHRAVILLAIQNVYELSIC
jgi:hypothetical protein